MWVDLIDLAGTLSIAQIDCVMPSIKFHVKKAVLAILISHCMISSIAATSEIRRFSSTLNTIRETICQIDASSICLSELLDLIKTSGKSTELVQILESLNRVSNVLMRFKTNENCNTTKEKRLPSMEKTSKELGVDRLLTNEEVAFDVHILKKELRCTTDVLMERYKRDVGAASSSPGNSAVKNTICWEFWRGDGFCDLGCNTEEFNYDDGDCCYETCIAKIRRYPCGYTGFQCEMKTATAPSWSKDLKLCFKWRANGDKLQCDRAQHGKVCAPFGSMTKYYYDDTDERNGGCVLSWSIQAQTAPSWFWSRLRLCLFSYSDGNPNQCNYGKNSQVQCKSANYWLHYIDDTDNRPGSCFLRWRLVYWGMKIWRLNKHSMKLK